MEIEGVELGRLRSEGEWYSYMIKLLVRRAGHVCRILYSLWPHEVRILVATPPCSRTRKVKIWSHYLFPLELNLLGLQVLYIQVHTYDSTMLCYS